MPDTNLFTLLVLAGLFFLLWLLIKLFRTPLKLLLKLLVNTGLGFVTLFLLNFFGDYVGLSLGLNWINALIVGVAGFPGLVLLLLLKYVF